MRDARRHSTEVQRLRLSDDMGSFLDTTNGICHSFRRAVDADGNPRYLSSASGHRARNEIMPCEGRP
jgi:hypothetical protein